METELTPSLPFGVDVEVPAIIEWLADGQIKHLDEDIILEACLTQQQESPAASFRLRIPIFLKGLRYKTYFIVVIDPEAIVSFDFKRSAVAPRFINDKFMASGVTSLNFQTYRSVDVIAPASLLLSESITLHNAAAGKVLD